MSVQVEAPENVAAPASAEPILEPVLSSRWALSGLNLAVVAAFCLLFIVLNHLPLRNTDLWGHVVFGKHVLTQHELPTRDLLQPLAEGMRVVNVHWLSQTVFAGVERLGGPEALVSLFTLVVGLSYVVAGRMFFLLTQSKVLATTMTGLVLAVGWNRVATIRPENFAVLLFAVLLWLLIGRRVRRDESILTDDVQGDRWLWVGIPLIALLWANLHGSFPIMIVTLACFWLGRVMEVAWRERDVEAVLYDREARRQLYWLELAVAATLINPNGIDAWIEAVRFSSNANLRDVMEWAPLVFTGPGGCEFALACVALAFAWRHSRRPVAFADVLLLGVFGLLAVLQVRMTGWFALVWGVALAPHAADIVAAWRERRALAQSAAAATDGEPSAEPSNDLEHSALRFRFTLGCVGLIWITFAFSTLSRPLIGGKPRGPAALYGDGTPLGVSAFLAKTPLAGQAFNPQYWGDWLGRIVPQLPLFATTNVHLLPRVVWSDYQRIARADNGWEGTLGRYAVRTVIVDRKNQPVLARAMKASSDWTQVYEDEQALVFRLKATTGAAPATTEAAPATKH